MNLPERGEHLVSAQLPQKVGETGSGVAVVGQDRRPQSVRMRGRIGPLHVSKFEQPHSQARIAGRLSKQRCLPGGEDGRTPLASVFQFALSIKAVFVRTARQPVNQSGKISGRVGGRFVERDRNPTVADQTGQ